MITRLLVPGRRGNNIKKPLIPILMILSGVIAGVIIAGAVFKFTGFSIFRDSYRKTVSAESADNSDVTLLAYTVLGYIRDGDYTALSQVVHPGYGVLISPYATINPATDRRFTPEQIAALETDTSVYVWGVYNGSGEPIELTPEEYFAEFIPAAEYMDAAVIGINKIVRSGNALENITDIFPGVRYVDFHKPGGEPVEEFDWSSLRLGFMEYDGYLRLVAIVFSKWTV